MADFKKLSQTFIFLTFSLLIISTTSLAAEINSLSLRDLNSAIFTLRSNGYNLFANAIAVSDISFQLLSPNSTEDGVRGVGSGGYTLLAPPNSALFSLDMSTDSFTYISSLRFHVIPRRLSYADLWNVSLSASPYVDTLAHGGHAVAVASIGEVVSVDGVRISFPDMHLRPAIAVHGLDGILSSSAVRVDELGFTGAPQPFAGSFLPENDAIPAPTPGVSGESYFDYETFPSAGYLSPVNDESPSPSPEMMQESYFDSALIPPSGFFSSEIQEINSPGPAFRAENDFNSVSLPPEFQEFPTPSSSPSPTPTRSVFPTAWSDSEAEYLSPFTWPPESTFTPSPAVSSESSQFNPLPQSPATMSSESFPPTVAIIPPPSQPAMATERSSPPAVVNVPQSPLPWSVTFTPTFPTSHAPPPPPPTLAMPSVSVWAPTTARDEKAKHKHHHHHHKHHHHKKSSKEEAEEHSTRHHHEDYLDYHEYYADEHNLNKKKKKKLDEQDDIHEGDESQTSQWSGISHGPKMNDDVEEESDVNNHHLNFAKYNHA